MPQLRTSDLEGLLAFLRDAQAVDGPQPFTPALLDQLAELMRCEFACYSDLDLLHRVVHADVTGTNEGPTHELRDEDWDELASYGKNEHPSGVAKWSDVHGPLARQRYEARPDASELSVIDGLSVELETAAFDRTGLYFHAQAHDFTERDRLVAVTLRPHVAALRRNAELRRRLGELLDAFERGDDDESRGIVLLGRGGAVEHASPVAHRLVGRWFGELDGRLPPALEDWLFSARRPAPLRLERDGRRLVVEAPSSAGLIVREEIAPPIKLTGRERDVLRCVAAGKSTAETARLLWVTEATVNKHLEHVYRKLGVHSRTAALARLSACLN